MHMAFLCFCILALRHVHHVCLEAAGLSTAYRTAASRRPMSNGLPVLARTAVHMGPLSIAPTQAVALLFTPCYVVQQISWCILISSASKSLSEINAYRVLLTLLDMLFCAYRSSRSCSRHRSR
jgi:hypothetical protein